ncbi:ciliary microtubule-associated protein 2-like [Engraulis encrasicolus]|uniref:ciliary microtubule-associated protein 2-like n=1 Tax=Engraulis encrasicolus TaxID=184585 RepID=UPI002FD26BC3
MAEKKFKGAPFGTQSARFDVSSVHPANKRVGTYTEIPYCKRMTSEQERNLGPGTYNPDVSDFGPRAKEKHAKGPGWKRALETMQQCHMPGLLYREAWENKHFLKTKLGPATYKATDFIEELSKKPGSTRGVCNSRQERFPEKRCLTPGPGTYEQRSAPWSAVEEKRVKSAVTTPSSVVFGSVMDRFPQDSQLKKDVVGLGPGIYDVKASIDELLSSQTGKRGPYDLFTGRRDKPICSGYLASPKKVNNLCPGEYTKEMPRFGEHLEKPEKRKHGVFSRLEQYPEVNTDRIFLCTQTQCKKPATSPGPGWYEVAPVSQSSNQSGSCATPAPPFLTAAKRVNKSLVQQTRVCGPGDYNIMEKGRRSVSSHKSVFVSETKRYPDSQQRDKHLQERLQTSNVGVSRRAFSAAA